MATPFLLVPGTNGFTTAPASVMTTELNTLTFGAAATSSVAGPWSQSSYSNAMLLAAYFTSGGAFTPTAGGDLACWFLRSPDGGTNYETLNATPSSSVPALGRSPDFIIPLYEGGAALASTNIKWAQTEFAYPWVTAKLVVQNMSGVTLPASGNTIKIGAVEWQY